MVAQQILTIQMGKKMCVCERGFNIEDLQKVYASAFKHSL